MSNLKQVGLGMQQYIQDNDETYPHVYYDNAATPKVWMPYGEPSVAVQTFPYVKSLQVWLCPSQKTGANSSVVTVNSTLYRTQYIFNTYYLRTSDVQGNVVRVAAVTKPAEIIQIGEQLGGSSILANWGSVIREYPELRLSFLHLEGSNFLYGDGHVKWQPRTKVQSDTNENAQTWGLNARWGSYAYGT